MKFTDKLCIYLLSAAFILLVILWASDREKLTSPLFELAKSIILILVGFYFGGKKSR